MAKVEVTIQLKPTLMDAQGATINKALHNLGYRDVRNVRIGKFIELEVEVADAAQVEAQVREMCEKLLANPIIEDYRVSLNAEEETPPAHLLRESSTAVYAVTPTPTDTEAPENWRGFHMSYEELSRLSEEEQRALGMEAWSRYEDWIYRRLEEYGAQWIMVVEGKVVRWSQTMEDCPTSVEGRQFAEETNQLPWVFPRQILIEETAGSPLPGGDYYPTLEVSVVGRTSEVAEEDHKTITIAGDLDTGSPSCFLNYDELHRYDLFDAPLKLMMYMSRHLGEKYFYYRVPLLLRAGKPSSAVVSVNCNCVPDWRHSPLRKTNSQRQALWGRDLLLKMPLTIKVDGSRRTTEILDP